MSFKKVSQRQERRLLTSQIKCMLGDCSPVKVSKSASTNLLSGHSSHTPLFFTDTASTSTSLDLPKVPLLEDEAGGSGKTSSESTIHFLKNVESSVSDESIETFSDHLSESHSEIHNLNEYDFADGPDKHDNLFDGAMVDDSGLDRTSSVNFLNKWALKNNITHTALNELLQWFSTNPQVNNLPKDARTVLSTPKQIEKLTMGDGLFHYFGLTPEIKKVFIKYESKNSLNQFLYILDFNIDGLPIHKSTKENFWPILCKIYNYPLEPPFVVALYCGPSKPPINEFFKDFVAEIKLLKENSLVVENKYINIECRSFCCDAPARAYVKATMSFNSYQGCDKCLVQGKFVRRMVFLDCNAALREDKEFSEGKYGNYHKGVSPLNEIGIGMVTAFPVDYMHCVCLGVMRKLLFLWRDGSRLFRLTPVKLELLEIRLKKVQKLWPCEFNRYPRTLKDLEHWKATELRQFLLYLTPLMSDILSTSIFSHIMLLKFGMTILLNKELNVLYNNYADNLLRLFVSHSIRIYGIEFSVYNVHALIHLASDANRFESLNNVNSFSFENYLGCLKRFLRKSNQNLQQVCNRIYEGRQITVVAKSIGVCGKLLKTVQNKSFYPKLLYGDWTFSCKEGNNCAFLKNETILFIKSIFVEDGNIYVSGVQIEILNPFVSYPASSTFISMFKVKLTQHVLSVPYKAIKCKGMLLPDGENMYYFCCPLIHGM